MPNIPPEILEQIAAANDIVEVIGSYFPLKRAGATYKALCPFHQEKSPSFTVNPQRQIFKCFGCGAGGGVFRFVMDYEHIEFPAAVKKLAERVGIRFVEEELSAEDQARLGLRRRVLALHAEAADWFHQQLMRTRSAQIARDYLKGRGINGEIAKNWKLGFAPDSWDALFRWAADEGYSDDEILGSGLVKLRVEDQPKSGFRDRFRQRVMFPICNDTGEVIAFSGRILEANPKAAKYVNSPETILFTKGSVLFGLHRSKRALIEKKSAIVCEGQLDLITAFESGVQNVIAPQGTAFTDRQAHILKRYVEEVVLCFDADAAGEKAAERSVPILLAENLGVRIVAMPPGEDPDSLIRGQGPEAFRTRVSSAKDFFEFQLDRLASRPDFETATGRVQAQRKIAAFVGMVQDAVLRDALVTRAAKRLEIEPRNLARIVRQPSKSADPALDKTAQEEPAATLDKYHHLLLQASLHDATARQWLAGAPWRDLLAQEPDATLACKVLAADLAAERPGEVNAFVAGLSSSEEAIISELLTSGPPRNAAAVIQDCWNQIARRQIVRRLDAIKARLASPQLDATEASGLQNEFIDLAARMQQIPRPSAQQV